MNKHKPYHVLLVDDDKLLCALIDKFSSDYPFFFKSLTNGEALVPYLEQEVPNFIVLDIMLPGRDGLYWLAWLKSHYAEIPILLLSARSSAQDRVQGLELGADDYLVKPFHPKELMIRVQNILRHHINGMAEDQFQIGVYLFDAKHGYLLKEGVTTKLSTRETALLLLFCQHAGQVLSRDDIWQALHGIEHHPLNRNIDMLVNRLRKKLTDHSTNPAYLQTVWNRGYRLVL